MINKVELFADLANLVLSIIFLILVVKLVLRTEKGLDTAFKHYFVAAFIVIVASLIQMNKYFNIFSFDFSNQIYLVSRMFGLFFLVSGSYIMLKIVNKASE